MARSLHPFHHRYLLFLLIIIGAASTVTVAAALSLDLHHRFSDRVRQWEEDHGLPGAWWPEKGTAEYAAALSPHDRVLHRRSLVDGSVLTFANGNATFWIDLPGFLYYAVVELGTPNMTILVALDTGSSLFWVPCSLTPVNNLEGIYSPGQSSTSQNVPCNSSFCDLRSKCSGANSNCPYFVRYADDSSSLGILVEDVLYLRREDATSKTVEAQITFGCSEYVEGMNMALPYGIFGLGMGNTSVPSILSSKGIILDSFSMCFGVDGIGRINFGDKGSLDQEETPFNIDNRGFYNISITGMEVGNTSIDSDFSVIVDSGTSFTYLPDPVYTKFTESFNAQVQENRRKPDNSLPFEFCYNSSSRYSFQRPNISLIAKGGSKFPVSHPMLMFIERQQNVYICCLAVLKSRGFNIIGQNFMTGLRVVFDREKLSLGWKKFDCYSTENSSTRPLQNLSPAPSPAPSPGVAFEPSTSAEAPNPRSNHTQVVQTPRNRSSRSNSKISIIMSLLFFWAVL
ncbi:aspartyl protease family protein 1 [Musa acuminata AAA Group]|uniref:aspartyl protease family protein 1 n=1 Tax=Musa acuminata AAA Group TaxID=214697 RepID=UPI0031D9CAE1